MRVSVIHMNVTGSVEDNLKRARSMMREATMSDMPDLICLPEFFSRALGPGGSAEKAFAEAYEPTFSFLKEMSKELGIFVVGGTLLEKYGDGFYNTCLLLKKGKVLGKYRKMHPTTWEKKLKVNEGDKYFVYQTDFGKVGLLICADLFYPKMTKTLVSMGAEVIFLPVSASSTHPYVEGHPLVIARAKENLVYFVKSGNIMSFARGGRSAIISPWGFVKEAKKEDQEEIISADLDLLKLRECRQGYSV